MPSIRGSGQSYEETCRKEPDFSDTGQEERSTCFSAAGHGSSQPTHRGTQIIDELETSGNHYSFPHGGLGRDPSYAEAANNDNPVKEEHGQPWNFPAPREAIALEHGSPEQALPNERYHHSSTLQVDAASNSWRLSPNPSPIEADHKHNEGRLEPSSSSIRNTFEPSTQREDYQWEQDSTMVQQSQPYPPWQQSNAYAGEDSRRSTMMQQHYYYQDSYYHYQHYQQQHYQQYYAEQDNKRRDMHPHALAQEYPDHPTPYWHANLPPTSERHWPYQHQVDSSSNSQYYPYSHSSGYYMGYDGSGRGHVPPEYRGMASSSNGYRTQDSTHGAPPNGIGINTSPLSSTRHGQIADVGGESKMKKSKPHKDPNKPKRPLSAYNIFFRDERARMLQEIESEKLLNGDNQKDGNGKPKAGGAGNGTRARRRHKVSGVGFKPMAQRVASRWKALDKEELQRYEKLASDDLARYKREMLEYRRKHGDGPKQVQVPADNPGSKEDR